MKKKYIIITELIIWLLILSGGFYFFLYKTTLKDNTNNSYYLFFDDAGGLVKGSPVRLMGMNIGYVRDVKIFENKVFVSFLVTKENVKVPNRATATIEFYGLGGSTSLELSQKTSADEENEDTITPSDTYRIQDYWSGATLSANVMIDIYGSIGRTIHSTNILNHKDWIKQSAVIKDFATLTNQINEEESVIIHKMSELTKEYSKKKEKDKLIEDNDE
ncbi:MAG: MlaD family protein [Candidatus Avigastranaerophilus sp.]